MENDQCIDFYDYMYQLSASIMDLRKLIIEMIEEDWLAALRFIFDLSIYSLSSKTKWDFYLKFENNMYKNLFNPFFEIKTILNFIIRLHN